MVVNVIVNKCPEVKICQIYKTAKLTILVVLQLYNFAKLWPARKCARKLIFFLWVFVYKVCYRMAASTIVVLLLKYGNLIFK